MKRTNICPGCRELRLVFEDGDSIGVGFYVEKRVYFGSPADIDRETAVSLKCRSIYAHVAERVALGVAEVSWENFYVFAGNFLSLITGRKAAQLEIMFLDWRFKTELHVIAVVEAAHNFLSIDVSRIFSASLMTA